MRPTCFGGEDNVLNTLYDPLGTPELKERIDTHTIAVLASEGKVTQHGAAKPEHQGKSVIPIAVTVVASEPGSFTATINIWGEALKRGSKSADGSAG